MINDPAFRERMEKAWGVKGLPANPGLTVTQMMDMAHSGDLKALYIIGENPMISDPDLNHARKCRKNLDFLVVQNIFLTETAKMAGVVLLKISSRRGEIEVEAKISEKAVKGTVFIPFHYAQAAANVLTNGALDPVAKIPEYKVCAIKLSKAA